jgi:CubicO group peptidase (beta-lactamase class C family)
VLKRPHLLGAWTGVLTTGSQILRLRLVIASTEAATLYSLDQGGQPIPSRVITLTADHIEIEVAAVQGRFIGRLDGFDRIEGIWKQSVELPLALLRGEAGLAAALVAPLTQEGLAALRREAGSPALAAAAERRGEMRRFWIDGERAAGSGISATRNDLWHLGSITKAMTATLVARLVDSDALHWDDTVFELLGDVIPDMRDEYKPATLRHLLSHRSGLPKNILEPDLERFSRDADDVREERKAYADIALAMLPRGPMETTFEYSNNGYVIVGAMLEHKFDRSWEQLIRTHVFEPLGLQSAGFGAPGNAGQLSQPAGHALAPDSSRRAFRIGDAATDNAVVLGPAGRVHMSLNDLLTFLATHRDQGRFLSPATWHVLHTPPFGGEYAMGWVVRPDGVRWHNGSNTLWYAEVQFNAANGTATAAVSNDGNLRKSGLEVGRALLAATAAI